MAREIWTSVGLGLVAAVWAVALYWPSLLSAGIFGTEQTGIVGPVPPGWSLGAYVPLAVAARWALRTRPAVAVLLGAQVCLSLWLSWAVGNTFSPVSVLSVAAVVVAVVGGLVICRQNMREVGFIEVGALVGGTVVSVLIGSLVEAAIWLAVLIGLLPRRGRRGARDRPNWFHFLGGAAVSMLLSLAVAATWLWV